ncbi:MAG: hypothetical protein WBE70_18215 [Candidatus Acidiferrum sp.]
MSDHWFVVELTGGEPGDPAYVQPVKAEQMLEDAEYLHFVQADGSLCGLFLKSIVRSWRKATVNESLRWDGPKPPAS